MIPIVGVQKTSLIDYPQKISTIFFTPGCSFRCPYCHNPQLVLGNPPLEPIPHELILEHLKRRQNVLDGVVITGGEPTLHGEDLVELIKQIKSLGYLVKLDTNGTAPDLLRRLIDQSLVDYIAMDLKTSLSCYSLLAGVDVDTDIIKGSIDLLLKSIDTDPIQVEFRTTLHPRLHTEDAFLDMVKLIEGAPLYVLQTFRPNITLDHRYQETYPFTDANMQHFLSIAQKYVKKCLLR